MWGYVCALVTIYLQYEFNGQPVRLADKYSQPEIYLRFAVKHSAFELVSNLSADNGLSLLRQVELVLNMCSTLKLHLQKVSYTAAKGTTNINVINARLCHRLF